MPDEAYNILFLCTRNAARSVIAEAIVNRDGHGRFHAVSAGTNPAREIRPEVVKLLKRMNYNPEGAYTKSLKDLIQRDMPNPDFLITLCDQDAEKTCPVWPGHRMTALWPIPDPGDPDQDETRREQTYADMFRVLNDRLSYFMNLPRSKLDRLSMRGGIGSETFARLS